MASGFEKFFAGLQFGFGKRLDLYRQISALAKTGMSKTDAVSMSYKVASREGEKPKEALAVVLGDLILSMKNGDSFGTALSKWAPIDDVMVIEAIEESPDFSFYLDRYCEMMVKKAKIRSTIIGGLIYPIALLGAIYGLMYYFGQEVTPKIEPLLPIEQWTGAASFLAFLNWFAEELAVPIVIGTVTFFTVLAISLPRWAGFGRKFADKLPLYSTYRMYTGISFMTSISSLIQGGMPVVNAVEKVLPRSNRYTKSRIRKAYINMLNGDNFGAALHRTKTGWPDPEMNLSIKIFAETQDLSEQLGRLSEEWLNSSQKKIETSMGSIKTLVMVAVFGVVLGIVGGMYGLQDLIAQKLQ